MHACAISRALLRALSLHLTLFVSPILSRELPLLLFISIVRSCPCSCSRCVSPSSSLFLSLPLACAQDSMLGVIHSLTGILAQALLLIRWCAILGTGCSSRRMHHGVDTARSSHRSGKTSVLPSKTALAQARCVGGCGYVFVGGCGYVFEVLACWLPYGFFPQCSISGVYTIVNSICAFVLGCACVCV